MAEAAGAAVYARAGAAQRNAIGRHSAMSRITGATAGIYQQPGGESISGAAAHGGYGGDD